MAKDEKNNKEKKCGRRHLHPITHQLMENARGAEKGDKLLFVVVLN